MKKKVVVQLPPVAKEAPVTTRYALELEALDSVAEIVEVDGVKVLICFVVAILLLLVV